LPIIFKLRQRLRHPVLMCLQCEGTENGNVLPANSASSQRHSVHRWQVSASAAECQTCRWGGRWSEQTGRRDDDVFTAEQRELRHVQQLNPHLPVQSTCYITCNSFYLSLMDW